jgi:hypothetical protein
MVRTHARSLILFRSMILPPIAAMPSYSNPRAAVHKLCGHERSAFSFYFDFASSNFTVSARTHGVITKATNKSPAKKSRIAVS